MISNSKKILVVDDDEMARIEMAKCAEQQGYDAIIAKNGSEALEKLQSELPDLILLDLIMPGLNGLGVLRRIRDDEKFKEIPVIIVSAVDDSESVAECVQLGALKHFSKPLDLDLLAKNLNTILDD